MGWVVIVPPDVIPPIIDTLFKDKLKGGYADLLMFPNWVWLFEVGGGVNQMYAWKPQHWRSWVAPKLRIARGLTL